jgi:ribonuclease T2
MTKFFTVLLMAFWLNPGHATELLQGHLLAEKDCPALHSIKKQTNPGGVRLQSGNRYVVTGQNKTAATYYQVHIDGIETPQRWVAVTCGKLETDCKDCQPNPRTVTNQNKDYLLAVSWQAGFCQLHKQKAECASQTPERFDATHLTLHGLWPQPQKNAYCGVSGNHKAIDRNSRWDLLPQPPVSAEVMKNLEQAMPGTASMLDRHEWLKHGTCYGTSADEYFQEAMMMVNQINASPVRALFADNVGKNLTSNEIRARFDQAFGSGSGGKVSVQCAGNLITEIWINLRGEITANTTMSEVLKSAPPAKKTCAGGKIDPAGF